MRCLHSLACSVVITNTFMTAFKYVVYLASVKNTHCVSAVAAAFHSYMRITIEQI